MLEEFIVNFQNDKDDQEFNQLKNAMREVLHDIVI